MTYWILNLDMFIIDVVETQPTTPGTIYVDVGPPPEYVIPKCYSFFELDSNGCYFSPNAQWMESWVDPMTLTATRGYVHGITDDLQDQVDNLAVVASSGSYSDLVGKPTLAAVATTGSYADLTGKPSLAAVASSGSYSDLSGKPTLSAVAVSGAYADLSGKPTIPAAQVNSDWNSTSGLSQVLNKPFIRRTEAYEGTTDSNGEFSVTYTTAFSVRPVVNPQITVQSNPNQSVRVTASSTTGFTVKVEQRATLSVLGLDVLAASPTAVSGQTVSVSVMAR